LIYGSPRQREYEKRAASRAERERRFLPMRTKRLIIAVLVGALCLVIGVASVALANRSTEGAGEVPALRWGRQMGKRMAACMPGRLSRALGAGFVRRLGEDVRGLEPSQERLEMAIERVTENIERLTERLGTFQSKLPEYEARIAEIEDETLREFAQRRLDILRQQYELGEDRLAIIHQRLGLLQDQLDYAKSR
jgi:hypothetical protein